MTRIKASDFGQRLLNLYDGTVHGGFSKRECLAGAGKYMASDRAKPTGGP